MASVRALSHYWFSIQSDLFPWLEEQLGELTENEQRLVTTLDLIRIEKFTTFSRNLRGRPKKKRDAIARAFVAKAEYNSRQLGLYWTAWHVIKSYGASVVGSRKAEYQAKQHFQGPSLNLLRGNYRRMSIRQ
jgi:hypothetical protein